MLNLEEIKLFKKIFRFPLLKEVIKINSPPPPPTFPPLQREGLNCDIQNMMKDSKNIESGSYLQFFLLTVGKYLASENLLLTV